mgnify:CR=1 FL=1
MGPAGPAGDAAALRSGPDLTALGDSLTSGVGCDSTPYPALLREKIEALPSPGTVVQLGVSGETSAEIAGRAGARPWLASFAGGEIGATVEPIPVELKADTGQPITTSQNAGGLNPVDIAGVRGTLSHDGEHNWSFTRTQPGSAVRVARPAAVATRASREVRGDITIMWMGQNDSTNDATEIIAREQAVIQELTAPDPLWLVLGLTTRSVDYRAPMERQFLRAFGRRFLNVREYAATYAALEEVGIAPTPEDDVAIAEGSVPPSLKSDNIHFNAAGCQVVADAVWGRLVEFGWDDTWR